MSSADLDVSYAYAVPNRPVRVPNFDTSTDAGLFTIPRVNMHQPQSHIMHGYPRMTASLRNSMNDIDAVERQQAVSAYVYQQQQLQMQHDNDMSDVLDDVPLTTLMDRHRASTLQTGMDNGRVVASSYADLTINKQQQQAVNDKLTAKYIMQSHPILRWTCFGASILLMFLSFGMIIFGSWYATYISKELPPNEPWPLGMSQSFLTAMYSGETGLMCLATSVVGCTAFLLCSLSALFAYLILTLLTMTIGTFAVIHCFHELIPDYITLTGGQFAGDLMGILIATIATLACLFITSFGCCQCLLEYFDLKIGRMQSFLDKNLIGRFALVAVSFGLLMFAALMVACAITALVFTLKNISGSSFPTDVQQLQRNMGITATIIAIYVLIWTTGTLISALTKHRVILSTLLLYAIPPIIVIISQIIGRFPELLLKQNRSTNGSDRKNAFVFYIVLVEALAAEAFLVIVLPVITRALIHILGRKGRSSPGMDEALHAVQTSKETHLCQQQVQSLEARVRQATHENLKLCFLNKQSAAQVRKLELDYLAQKRELNERKSCGACTCLDYNRRRSRSASDKNGKRSSSGLKCTHSMSDVQHRRLGSHDSDVSPIEPDSATESSAGSKQNGRAVKAGNGARSGSSLGSENAASHQSVRSRHSSAGGKGSNGASGSSSDVSRPSARKPNVHRHNNGHSNRHNNGGVNGTSSHNSHPTVTSSHNSHSELNKLRQQFAESESRNDVLRAQLHRVEESQRTNNKHVNNELDRVQHELLQLKNENERLNLLVGSKETNLLRCEQQIRQLDKDKRKLKQTIAELPVGTSSSAVSATHTTANSNSVPTLIARDQMRHSRSDTKITDTQKNGSRSRSTSQHRAYNSYCSVCRDLLPNLQNEQPHVPRTLSVPKLPLANTSTHNMAVNQHGSPIARSPDSGYGDHKAQTDQSTSLLVGANTSALPKHGQSDLAAHNKKLTDRVVRLTAENRKLSKEKDRINEQYHKLQHECNQTNHELVDAKIRLAAAERPRVSSARAVSSDRLARDMQKIMNELQEMKNSAGIEKSRYATNESLLHAQKIRLEHENADLRSQIDRLQSELRHARDMAIRQPRQFIMFSSTDRLQSEADRMRLESQNRELQISLDIAQRQYERVAVELRELRERETQRINTVKSSMQHEPSTGSSSDEAMQQNVKVMQEQIRSKEREVSRLRDMVQELGKEYSAFQSSLSVQEDNLVRLQSDLTSACAARDRAEAKVNTLQAENQMLRDELQAAHNENQSLRRELALALDEQDAMRLAAQSHMDQLQSYEALLKRKEEEREKLRERLIELNGGDESILATLKSVSRRSMNESLESQSLAQLTQHLGLLKDQKDRWELERRAMQQQLQRCEESLSRLQAAEQQQSTQQRSLMDDLAAARKIILDKDDKIQTQMRHIAQLEADLNAARSSL